MSQSYTFPKSAFPISKVHAGQLHSEIKASPSIVTALEGVSVGAECQIDFAGALSGAEQTALAALVAAHPGYKANAAILVPSTMVPLSEAVSSNGAWQELAGVAMSPGFFTSDPAELMARVVCQVKTTGTGAKLRLVENDGASDVVIATLDLPNTGGAWQQVKMDSSVALRLSENSYRLEADGAGAGLEIRYASGVLLKVRIEMGD